MLLQTTKINNISITAIIKKDNIVGLQFHPENSGIEGLKLKIFARNKNEKKILIIGYGDIAKDTIKI